METCIYCLVEKKSSEFNREHVVPQAFGLFENNMVLNCVCSECNDYFGKVLDLKLARDSPDGYLRYILGLKDFGEFKNLGARSETVIRYAEEGPFKGMLLKLIPSDEGDRWLVDLIKQVGVAVAKEGPYRWYAVESLPQRSEIEKDLGVPPSSVLHYYFVGGDLEEFRNEMQMTGVEVSAIDVEGEIPRSEQIATDLVFRQLDPDLRVLAKIVFNYLAYVYGPGTCRTPQFNMIRKYIRFGRIPERQPVWPANRVRQANVAGENLGHIVGVERVGPSWIGQVSLMRQQRYGVFLNDSPFLLEYPIRSGHWFDLSTKKIVDAGNLPVPKMLRAKSVV